ncbi:hypothetical protein N658DRAFT_555362 [Parathielavia hyrcaniae]|uniref:Uncharacterized protein n=1 Tax=Parathielavia hyrcaniae TaxID=113614 RepID=A0AAN6T762_9PEZI|nr:hypothetical protein N658DRAFT_555362 [Parathielavia hyrcaniae]
MSTGELNRAETPPFHLKLFYRTGAFHRPDEFSTTSPTLPPHLSLHTWSDCTLLELSHLLLDASPSILPSPAIGTRLCFRLLYADTRAASGAATNNRIIVAADDHNTDNNSHMPPPRYVAKDLGSVVLGRGGPGAGPDEGVSSDDDDEEEAVTLADARFITGDLLSCAILPPDELTGDVVPASSARAGRRVGKWAVAEIGYRAFRRGLRDEDMAFKRVMRVRFAASPFILEDRQARVALVVYLRRFCLGEVESGMNQASLMVERRGVIEEGRSDTTGLGKQDFWPS